MSAYKTSVLVIMVMMVASCSNTPTTISKPQDHFSLNSSSPIGGYVDLAQQGVGAEARFILCDYNDEQCISKRSAKLSISIEK